MPLSLAYLTFMSAIGGFLFGYDTSVISGALILIDEQFDLTDVQEGLIVSMTVLGAWIASLVSGKLADYFGRKPLVLASSIIFTIGSFVLTIAGDYDAMVLGRFIVGVGVGAASMCMPIFLGEIAPPESRGAIVTCINVACTGGQFISCLIGGGLSYYHNGWRYMFGIAAIPAILQFFGFMSIPESPRWLISQGREAEAEKALQMIRPEGEDIGAEFSEMFASVMGDDQQRSSTSMSSAKDNDVISPRDLCVYSFWIERNLFRALVLGCSIQACQQLIGINTVMYYSATIMRQAGFDSRSAIWLSAGTSFCNFVGSLVGLSLVDKLGRRPLTLSSLLGVVCALGAISVAFYNAEVSSQAIPFDLDNPSTCREHSYCFDCIQDTGCGFCSYDNVFSCVAASDSEDGDKTPADNSYCPSSSFYGNSCPGAANTRAGWLIFAAVCVYLLCFGPGMGCMPWCFNAEIYPTSVRGMGNSIATSCNWMFNFLVSLTFLQLVAAINEWGTFLLYTSIGGAFLVYFAKYMPETKGLALEDVEKLFSDDLWGRQYYFRNCLVDCGGFFGVGNLLYHDVGAQSASSTSSAPGDGEYTAETVSNPLIPTSAMISNETTTN